MTIDEAILSDTLPCYPVLTGTVCAFVAQCASSLLHSLYFIFDSEFHGEFDVVDDCSGLVLWLSSSVDACSQKDRIPSMPVGA
jgi:hypothetical protein